MLPQKKFIALMEQKEWEPVVIRQYIKFSPPKSQFRTVLGFRYHPFECDCSASGAQKILKLWKEG